MKMPIDAESVAPAIVRDMTMLDRVICAPGYDRALERLGRYLPFDVHDYSAADEHNGWVIPPRWEVTHATIADAATGAVVYDGTRHPLAVIALSAPFRGRVSRAELRKHLHYDHRFEDAIPWHFRQMYQSWRRDWGFCVTRRFVDSLEDREYLVRIETREAPGILRVAEYTHHGATPETYAFVAHLDHAGMSNDDLAGCAVGVELFRRLAGRRTRSTYKLLLLPEIIGSEYWWARTNRGNPAKVVEALFLEMLGTETELALQSSRNGASVLEHAAGSSLRALGLPYHSGPFGTIVGNDEPVWEAYGIPMASLSRFPYPEYHSSLDDPSIITERALDESLSVLLATIDRVEASPLFRRRFEGTICLSNPRYDLYVDAGQPAYGELSDGSTARLRLLMELIPTLGPLVSAAQLADRVDLPEKTVMAYLRRWVEKGLLEQL